MRSYLFITSFMMTCIFFFALSVAEEAPPISNAPPPPPTPSLPIKVFVLRGKTEEGAVPQQFSMLSGETLFVPVSPSQSANQPEDNGVASPETLEYDTQRGQLSAQIATKINQIQSKQFEFDTEIFPAMQEPVLIEKQKLQMELQVLQDNKTKLEAQHIAKNAQKERAAAFAQSATGSRFAPRGLYIKTQLNMNDHTVTMELRSQGFKDEKNKNEIKMTLQVPVGKWTQVPNQLIWIKVDL